MQKFKCPCCGFYTLDEPNSYEICEVCWWEDDEYQLAHPDYAGGANGVSLAQARENYKNIHVSDSRCADLARQPYASELSGLEHPPAYS